MEALINKNFEIYEICVMYNEYKKLFIKEMTSTQKTVSLTNDTGKILIDEKYL